MTDLTTIPVPNESFCVRRLGDETIFLAEGGDAIHSIDETGTFIWESVDGKRTLDEILGRICEEFEVERDTAATDLVRFVDELVAKDIVKLEG